MARTTIMGTVPRRIDELLAEYGESHRNAFNKAIHWLAVPAIAWCIVAFLVELPFPESLRVVRWLDWSVVAVLPVLYYYARLSLPLTIGMGMFAAALIALAHTAKGGAIPLWQLALAVFVVAWIFQAVGHAVEGRKPSFLKDIQFLLVGPAWLLSLVLDRAGIRY